MKMIQKWSRKLVENRYREQLYSKCKTMGYFINSKLELSSVDGSSRTIRKQVMIEISYNKITNRRFLYQFGRSRLQNIHVLIVRNRREKEHDSHRIQICQRITLRGSPRNLSIRSGLRISQCAGAIPTVRHAHDNHYLHDQRPIAPWNLRQHGGVWSEWNQKINQHKKWDQRTFPRGMTGGSAFQR